jgi:m7GpppX diphosphatase
MQHLPDPQTHMVTLLGTYKAKGSASGDAPSPTIIRIEKTALPVFSDGLVSRTEPIDSNDIVPSTTLYTLICYF